MELTPQTASNTDTLFCKQCQQVKPRPRGWRSIKCEPCYKTAKAASNRERQRRFRARQAEANKVHVFGYVYRHQMAGLNELITALERDPDLQAGPAKSERTGRLRGVRN